MQFQVLQRRIIPQSWAPKLCGIGIDFTQFRWHTQKNLENVKTMSQARCPFPRLCLVLESLRALEGACHLNKTECWDLAVYYNSKTTHQSQPAFTSHPTSKICLQQLTSRAQIRTKTLPPLSLRVGSCILLREGGHAFPFAKTRIHWNPETSLIFLRSTAHMAFQFSANIS